MAYSKFTFNELENKFNITQTIDVIFDRTKIKPIQPSNWLIESLQLAQLLSNTTEKAVSERIVSPILIELKRNNIQNIQIFSGEDLNVNKPSGLSGECDFIISKGERTLEIKAPILQIVEAKKGDIETALPQCAAQMYGAFLFNQNQQKPISAIYGATTNRSEWRFLKLENNIITIDERPYNTSDLPQILGVLQVIIDFYKD